MLYNTLHNRWLRILMGVVGCFISALSLNVFIVPQGLYTGGLLGFCQVIRTLLYTHFGIGGGSYDLAGVLYAIFNIPLFLLAYKALGRDLLLKTVICTVAYSFFYSILPAYTLRKARQPLCPPNPSEVDSAAARGAETASLGVMSRSQSSSLTR